jgi:hypothetical protein
LILKIRGVLLIAKGSANKHKPQNTGFSKAAYFL